MMHLHVTNIKNPLFLPMFTEIAVPDRYPYPHAGILRTLRRKFIPGIGMFQINQKYFLNHV